LDTPSASDPPQPRYINGVFVAKKPPGEDISDWQTPTNWLQLQPTVHVVDRDPQTGRVERVWTAPSVPSTRADLASGLCLNVLETLHYTLERSGTGQIVSARVTATVSHQPLPAGGGHLSVTQAFSVSFAADGAVAAPPKRSGNPGYADGMPVRAGLLEANATSSFISVIKEMAGGMTLPRMGDAMGRCAVCANGTGSGWDCRSVPDERSTVPVLFGQDIEQGCTITLNRQELQSFCDEQELHPLLSVPDAMRIGMFGDSDTKNAFEWLPSPDQAQEQLSDSSENPAAGQAYDRRGECLDVVTGTHIQILTADTGNVRNPQRKILGARVVYETANWLARVKAMGEASHATYSIRSSVSFLNILDGGTVEVIPPPLLSSRAFQTTFSTLSRSPPPPHRPAHPPSPCSSPPRRSPPCLPPRSRRGGAEEETAVTVWDT